MLPEEISKRLFDVKTAFDHPATVAAVVAIVAGLILASVLVRILRGTNRISDKTFEELLARTRSWYVLAIALVLPILLGAAWVCIFFLVLSLLCFREYAVATRLNSVVSVCTAVVIAMIVNYFAVFDHWMGLFTTSWPLGICLIAIVALIADQPKGYIHRVALAIIGFALVGITLSHLAFISNDVLYRPILLWILLCTELNDVFAYISGKTIGKRKLIPNTSPNKTIGGAIGAVVLTTTLVAIMGHFVFQGTVLDRIEHLIALGILISVLGQCGDLVVSSIKRDLEIKDMSSIIPGHGGLLDRFDSLLLVAPAVFHYINYFYQIGSGQPTQVITGQ